MKRFIIHNISWLKLYYFNFQKLFLLFAKFSIKKSYGKSLVFLNREILAAIGAKP